MTEGQTFPKWILIVSGLIALMEIMVSVMLGVSPASVLETIDFSGKDVNYLVKMWAARQFALGFIFAYATFKKSVPMLTLAYIFLLVMMVGDLVIGISQKDNGLIIGSLVMGIVSAAMIFVLSKKR